MKHYHHLMRKQFLLYEIFVFEPKPSTSWCGDWLNDDTPLAVVSSSLNGKNTYTNNKRAIIIII